MKVPEVAVVWLDGRLVPWGEANVHVLNQTLQYGWGVYEGMRAYRTPRGPALFRMEAHWDRLWRSAAMYGMEVPFERAAVSAAVAELIAANELDSCYVRPVVCTASGWMGMDVAMPMRMIIAVWPWEQFLGDGAAERGVRVAVSTWRRVPGTALPMGAKACGVYLNSMLARSEAQRNGFDEAILLNDDGNVTDACVENVFLVEGSSVVTPPLSDGPLPGITRATVMEMAARNGLDVRERAVTRSALRCADEVFLTGTAAEVVAVADIDGSPVGNGRPGPVTRRLAAEYHSVVTGGLVIDPAWLTHVSGGGSA